MTFYGLTLETEAKTLPDQIPDPDWENVRLATKKCMQYKIENDGGDSPSAEAWLLLEVFQALYGPHYELLFTKLVAPD